jgi:hypothetical protein
MNPQPIGDQPPSTEEQNSFAIAEEFAAAAAPEMSRETNQCCGDACQVSWKPSRAMANGF